MNHPASAPTRLALFAFALLTAAAATAQDLTPLDGFRFAAGAYFSDNDLSIRADGSDDIPGTHVDFQRDLGFDDSETAVTWQADVAFFDRHQISAFGYGYDSDAERTLSADFDIDDETFRADAAFAGDLDIRILGLAYTWYFHHGERNAFGVGLGAVRYELDSGLAASIDINGTVETATAAIDEDAWAPMIRAEYVQVLSPHWRLSVEAAAVRKPSGSVSGTAIDAGVGVEWYPWRHLGVAVRYNYHDIDLDLDKSSYSGEINVENRGPQVLATLRF